MKLACIDYDGVIADTLEDQLNLLRNACRYLAVGQEPLLSDFQLIENLAYEPMAKRLNVPENKIEDYIKYIHDNLTLDSNDALFPGIKEMLTKISSSYKVAIVTSNSQSTVSKTIANYGLDNHIIIYDGFMGLTKGERILKAAKELSIRVEDTFMIGDSRSDIRFGKSVGAKTIAVTWGYQSKETLALENPEYFVDRPDQIISILI